MGFLFFLGTFSFFSIVRSMKKISSLCILFIFFVCTCWVFFKNTLFVYAQEFPTLSIYHNNQILLRGKIATTLLSLESQKEISLRIESQENITLKKTNNTVKLWIPHHIETATGNLIIQSKKGEFIIPLDIQLPPKSREDYNIFWDMYQLHLQEKSLSCEIAASSDILSTIFGRAISEESLIPLLPKSDFYNMLPKKVGNALYWGNPQEGFVGYMNHAWDILAKQKLMTGYGVYEKPIAEIYASYWLKTQILTGELHSDIFQKQEHLSYLLEQLLQGNMVQLWGDWCTKIASDDGILESKSQLTSADAQWGISAKNTCYNVDEPRTLEWKYKDNLWKTVSHIGLDGEHAFILLGWKGDIQNPTHLRVWDTDTGYHSYPLQEWMRKWEKMQYRSIVIEKL